MYKTITGICPVHGKECTITMNYIDASTLSERVYIKGLARCEIGRFGCDYDEKCPLLHSFPKEIRE